MADYDPWRGLDMAQHSLDSASRLAPGVEAYREQEHPVHPMVEATARGLKHILDGGDPVEAGIKARLHIQNPDGAEAIWGHPSMEDFAGQQGQLAAQPQEPGTPQNGNPDDPGLGRTTSVHTPQGSFSVTRPPHMGMTQHPGTPPPPGLPSLGSAELGEEPSGPPMTRRDLADFHSLVPGITAVAGQTAAGRRLEERLATLEHEGAANRGTKEAIAGQTEQGKKERFAQIIEQKRAEMRQRHQDKMAEIAASLQRVREAKGVDQQIAAARIANDLITRYEGDRARYVSSDMSVMQSPEGQALLKETQPDIDKAKEILYPILNQYKRGGPTEQHSSSAQAAPPNVRQQAAKKLSDAFNE